MKTDFYCHILPDIDDVAQDTEEALAIARKHNLGYEVLLAIEQGSTPDEAQTDWGLFPFSSNNETEGK